MMHDAENLRVSSYPRALFYQKTRFGLVNHWWVLAGAVGMLFTLLNIEWYFTLLVVVLVLVTGFVVTRWEVEHLKIYLQYAKQRSAYEPGFFMSQQLNKRPEGMGREYLG